jgi:hypothetical protein
MKQLKTKSRMRAEEAKSHNLPSRGTKWIPVFLHYDVIKPPQYKRQKTPRYGKTKVK